MEGEKCSWTLARLKIIIIKTEDPSTLIATSIGTWLKNAKRKKKRT